MRSGRAQPGRVRDEALSRPEAPLPRGPEAAGPRGRSAAGSPEPAAGSDPTPFQLAAGDLFELKLLAYVLLKKKKETQRPQRRKDLPLLEKAAKLETYSSALKNRPARRAPRAPALGDLGARERGR